MFTRKIRFVGLTATVVTALALSAHVCAQQINDSPPARAAASEHSGGWDSESFERQQFREEMEQIRKEHEDLEHDSDALLDKCVNSHEEKISETCQKEKLSLRERRAMLHERTHALHEKMEAARQEELSRNAQLRDEYRSFHGEEHAPEANSTMAPAAAVVMTPR